MADYISSLTGIQMDNALIDMAEHNSEAWAVGQRNGNPVTSDDVTYHNNAQYYAQQAQSIAPASVTEAVRWDVAQTALTDANKEQARANIDAGKNGAWSNDNLLDNWYFVGGGSQLGDGIFPINQRGQTSYSNGTNTTIDRWKTEYSAVSVDADGITWTTTGDNRQFTQVIENYKLIEGETYTATIDCDILAGSARLFVGGVSSPWPTVAGSTVNVSSGITKVTFTFARESGYTGQYKLALASVGSCTVKLRKFKLEKGTVSTIVNDAPPDFGAELRKCQRYLRDVSLKRTPCYFDGTYSVAVLTLTGIEMAKSPTPSLITAGFAWQPAASASANLTAVSLITFEQYTPTIQFPLTTALSGMGMIYDTVVRLSCEL